VSKCGDDTSFLCGNDPDLQDRSPQAVHCSCCVKRHAGLKGCALHPGEAARKNGDDIQPRWDGVYNFLAAAAATESPGREHVNSN